jgi:hypothetical protein
MSRKKTTIRRRKSKKVKKKAKLWGLEPRTFNRGIRQFLDQDYANTLDDKEKQWLSDFNETYYGNKFPRKDKRGPKTNMFDKQGIPRTEIFQQTNERTRDIYTTNYRINESGNTERGYESENGENTRSNLFDRDRETIEEELIEYVDLKILTDEYIKRGYNKKEARELALEELKL